jgi:DNA topoisomerase I
MTKNLVIVESPAKAKIIKKYLNESTELKKLGTFHVIASFGHIRDLDKKKGIDIQNNFKPNYILIQNDFTDKSIKNLKDNIKKSDTIWLAADLDREGEAIAWHIKEHFKLKNPKRITFNEITKDAITSAVLNPRKIDNDLVDAQQARRFIDRIVGFQITPLLWKKFNTATSLSAGRVQSATLKIIIDKENEIQKFKTLSYYTVSGDFKIDKYDINNAKYEVNNSLHKFKTDKDAVKFLKSLTPKYSLDNIKTSDRSSKPPPPFITSSLQQSASGELKMSIKQVMGVAQGLYEAGLITYMRTDSYNLSGDFLSKVEKHIKENFNTKDKDYINITYTGKKSKNSQEAHEAIRPTNINLKPEDVKTSGKLKTEHKKLYSLIWKRTIASQMKPSKYYEIKICIKNSSFKKNQCFIGKFKIYYFEGYMIVYGEKSNSNFNLEKYIEDIKSNGEKLKMIEINAKQTWAVPPARYSEASIVKVLEKEGIGRPSTYSSILGKLYDKRYVEKKDMLGEEKEYVHYKLSSKNKISNQKVKKNITDEKSKLVPSDIGNVINDFMIKHFPDILDINFTSDLETNFDKIAEGNKKFITVMNKFYGDFSKNVNNVKKIVDTNVKKNDKVKIESYENKIKTNNIEYTIRIAKYGPVLQYLTLNDNKEVKNYISLVPYLKATNKEIEEIKKKDIKLLTSLPLKIGEFKNNDVILKYARYGFYLSNGNKNASIFKQYIPFILDNDYNEIMKLIKKEVIKWK